jgi:tRNA threonylcarbamoyladenosine biosynthesis protein TsaE
MIPSVKQVLPDLQSTRNLAWRLANKIRVPQTIALSGTLGAGKTQWTRDFCQALGVAPESITSPTYVLLQRYRGTEFEIYHFDFYRLESEQQVWDLGFDELQESPVVIVVEWADKFPQTLPQDRLGLHLNVNADGSRLASLQSTGRTTSAWLETSGLRPEQ